MVNETTRKKAGPAYPAETLDEASRDHVLRELRAANAQLEKMSRYKSQFLVNMSHELRTPLHAIIGFSELLHDEAHAANLDAKQRAYAGHILESGRHLLALVNDVLDLSRVEAGRTELHRKWVSPRDLAHRASAIVHPLAVKQGVTLEIDAASDMPEIYVDPLRVKQVFYNLFSNAIKFTPHGGRVRLSISENDEAVSIAISDTGIGMRAEDLPRLFQEYERLDDDEEREGTGIGLALTKKLVELHGGSIHVTSALGCGSTFVVDLPKHANSD